MDNTCQDKVVDICEVTSSVTVRKLSRGLLVRSVGRNHFILSPHLFPTPRRLVLLSNTVRVGCPGLVSGALFFLWM